MREIQKGVILGGGTQLKVAQVEIWCGTGTSTIFQGSKSLMIRMFLRGVKYIMMHSRLFLR